MENVEVSAHEPWNKGKLVGQKTPLKLKEIWAIRIRLQIACRCRELALLNLAIDSKLRLVISCSYASGTSAMARVWRLEPLSFSRRPVGRCSSRSPNPHAWR
jgi:hypothetical protein